MNKNYLNSVIASALLTTSLLAGGSLVALAQGATSSATSTSSEKGKEMKELRATNAAEKASSTMLRAKEKANKEIDRRIKGLDKLVERVKKAKKLTDAQKASLTKLVQDQKTALMDLKAKIAADTDLATLRADIQSIGKSHRIYALVLPQIEVIATADRALTLADTIAALGVKLQARITEAQAAGKDVTALNALMTSLNAQVSDAKTKAQAAIDLVLTLTPDNGDQAKFAANRKALQDARVKVREAHKALSEARHDASDITKALREFNGGKSATSTRVKAEKEKDEDSD
jgi:hypothetical protein